MVGSDYMITLIKNAHVFSPKDEGVKDVLIAGGRIIHIENSLDIQWKNLNILDAKGKTLIPGIIDQHIHITGGGGEGSFKSRVPEVLLSELTNAGITTLVGLLGTDSMTRSIENLLAKTKALEEEGVTAFCLTGSYDYPSVTLTGSAKKDIVFIKEILGVKLALSDHREPYISLNEFKKLAADVRVAGMISGKSAYIKLHMGDSSRYLDLVWDLIKQTDIPIGHFRPTHVGRDEGLYAEALKFNSHGGIIDITASNYSNFTSVGNLIDEAKNKKVDLSNLTMSSDGNGSWSTYDARGNLTSIGSFSCNTLLKSAVELYQNQVLDFSTSISLVTSNVAKALGLSKKGFLNIGFDADCIILDENLTIDSVMAKGKFLIKDKANLVKGTYEK